MLAGASAASTCALKSAASSLLKLLVNLSLMSSGSAPQLKSISSVFSTVFVSGYSFTFQSKVSNTGFLGASTGVSISAVGAAGISGAAGASGAAACTVGSTTGAPQLLQHFDQLGISFPHLLQNIYFLLDFRSRFLVFCNTSVVTPSVI